MNVLYLADAEIDPEPNNGSYTGGPAKGCLHTTESKGKATYRAGTKPHVELVPDSTLKIVRRYQFYPFNQPSRALVDGPDPLRTNRDHVIQVELCGTSDPRKNWGWLYVENWPDWYLHGIALAMREIEQKCGVKPVSSVSWKRYPDSYGAGNGVRLSDSQYDNYSGWLGHMHVPDGNVHGDPGLIPIRKLLPVVATNPDGGPWGLWPLPNTHKFGPNPKHYTTWHDGSKPGESGYVNAIRREVGNKARGPYDPVLVQDVKRWQTVNRIPPTGVVDKLTWETMVRR